MPNSIEEKVRATLPFVRFMQTGLPLPLSNWLIKIGLAGVRLEGDVRRERIIADGVSCDWIIPQNSLPDAVLLYLHGGGFVFGQTPLHLKMGADLARKMGARILLVDYRLAPEHSFPAALEDCFTAYRWLLEEGFSARGIVMGGDSAGGNLTLTTMMKLRDSGIPLPAAAACLSPVTDLSEKKSRNESFKDPLLPPRAVRLYSQSYLGKNDPRTPLISPVFGDLTGLPPLLVHVGEDEILREDATRLADRAKACGVDVQLEIYPRMWHVWQLFRELPQAAQSLEEVARFLNRHLEACRP